jgi:hypothetical protein
MSRAATIRSSAIYRLVKRRVSDAVVRRIATLRCYLDGAIVNRYRRMRRDHSIISDSNRIATPARTTTCSLQLSAVRARSVSRCLCPPSRQLPMETKVLPGSLKFHASTSAFGDYHDTQIITPGWYGERRDYHPRLTNCARTTFNTEPTCTWNTKPVTR